MRKLVPALLAAALILTLPGLALAGKIQLTKDTELKVRFDPSQKISSGKLKAGDEVAISLVEDYQIGGITIIQAGAKGTAKVKEVLKASRPGKPGKITVSFAELGTKGDYKAAGGKKIKLAGDVTKQGGGRKILSLLFILGLFIKGGQGDVDTSVDYTATVAETIVLESR